MFDFSAIHVGHVLLAIYMFLAGSVIVQLRRRGRSAFDDVMTDRDRSLVGAATFYLALPSVLLLHEFVQVLVLFALGGTGGDAWRWVLGDALPGGNRALGTAAIVALTLSGSVFAAVVGVGSILSAVRRPMNAAWNFARLELGRVVLGILLVVHPLASLLLGQGSASLLRETLNARQAHMGDAVALAYLALAVFAVRFSRKERFKRWYVELATPLFQAIAAAQAQVVAEPQSAAAHRDLGGAYLVAGRFEFAEAPLTRAVELDGSEPRAHFLLGMLRLRQERYADAERALCEAGQLVDDLDASASERRGLELEILIGLATARLRLKDAASALETAESALAMARRDPRVLLLYSDALVAAGRADEARAPLDLALEDAHGSVEAEIRRRLAALSRGR